MAETTPPLIGVLSDTHDQAHHLARVIAFFNEQRVSLVIHCGDWISPFTLNYYTRLDAPLFGVYGNNDGDKFLHARVAQRLGLSLTIEDQLLTLDEFDRRMAVYHGTSPQMVDALVNSGDYGVVFYGHNHQAKVEMVGNVLAMNPGSLMDVTTDAIRGASIGLYDPLDHSGRIVRIEDLANQSL